VFTLPFARGAQLVLYAGVVSGDVGLDVVAGAVRFAVRDGVQVATRFCVQFALLIGVAAAIVGPDAAARAVQHVVWNSAQVAPCVRCAAGAPSRRGGGGSCGGRRAGSGGGGGVACRVGRRACCRLREACISCFLTAWRWLTGSWTWWRGWCGLFRGTSCKMPLAWGV